MRVNGDTVAEAPIRKFTPVRFSITDAGLSCGADTGSAITKRYEGPFPFTGTLHRVIVELDGEPSRRSRRTSPTHHCVEPQ